MKTNQFGLQSVRLRKGRRCSDAAGQIGDWIRKEFRIARSEDGIFQRCETKRQWPCRPFFLDDLYSIVDLKEENSFKSYLMI